MGYQPWCKVTRAGSRWRAPDSSRGETTMATFSWANSVNGTWATASDWTLLPGPTGTAPPGLTTTNTDTAIISKDSSTSYTVTLGVGTTFNINTLVMGTTGAAGDPTLNIDGKLTTSTLTYDSGSDTPTTLEVDAGGVLDITTKIGEVKAVGETIKISGKGAGGLLELGSLTVANP